MLSMSKYKHGIQNIEGDMFRLTQWLSSPPLIPSLTSALENNFPDTLMLANKKSGSLQPLSKVAARCQDLQVLFHTYAMQAVREVPVDLRGPLGEY